MENKIALPLNLLQPVIFFEAHLYLKEFCKNKKGNLDKRVFVKQTHCVSFFTNTINVIGCKQSLTRLSEKFFKGGRKIERRIFNGTYKYPSNPERADSNSRTGGNFRADNFGIFAPENLRPPYPFENRKRNDI